MKRSDLVDTKHAAARVLLLPIMQERFADWYERYMAEQEAQEEKAEHAEA